MVAVDTSVVVRFLVRDDERQAQAVYRRFKQAERERERLFVPLLVLLETVWVLGSAYGKSRTEILSAVQDLREMAVIQFEKEEVVDRWIVCASETKADLADVLIALAAGGCGCESGLTFDKGAEKFGFFRLLDEGR
jgi:predicted nucleic-acid-binding protein